MVVLPSWIDREAWEGFMAMRKAIKKPMTPRAEVLVLKTLYELHTKGHDANASLDQSTVCNWQDVYEPKVREITNMKREYMTSLDGPMSKEQKDASDLARKEAMKHLRRVA